MISLFAKFIPNKPTAEASTTIDPQVEETFDQETQQEQQSTLHPDYFQAYYYYPLWI